MQDRTCTFHEFHPLMIRNLAEKLSAWPLAGRCNVSRKGMQKRLLRKNYYIDIFPSCSLVQLLVTSYVTPRLVAARKASPLN